MTPLGSTRRVNFAIPKIDRVTSVDKHAGVTGDELDEIGLPADARLFEEAAEVCFRSYRRPRDFRQPAARHRH